MIRKFLPVGQGAFYYEHFGECETSTGKVINVVYDCGSSTDVKIVRLHFKSKPDNYTESCMIDEADGWRGRSVWYLGRSVRYALKEVIIA